MQAPESKGHDVQLEERGLLAGLGAQLNLGAGRILSVILVASPVGVAIVYLSQPTVLILMPLALLTAVFGPRHMPKLLAMVPVVLLLPDVSPSFLPSTQLLLCGYIFFLWLVGFASRRWRVASSQALPVALAAFLLTSLMLASGASLAAKRADWALLVSGLSLCGVAMSAGVDVGKLTRFVGTATAVVAVLATTSYGSYFGFSVLQAGRTEVVTATGRSQGLGLNPNYLAVLLAVGMVLQISISLESGKRPWMLLALPTAIGLLATESRGAMLAALGGLLVVTATHVSWRGRLLLGSVALVGILATPSVLPSFVTTTGFTKREKKDLEISNYERLESAKLATRMIAKAPLLGHGHGSFADRALKERSSEAAAATHNEFLRISAESGLIAFALFVTLVGRSFLLAGAADRPVVVRGALTVYVIAFLFANVLSSLTVSATFWILIGYCWRLSTVQQAAVTRPGSVAVFGNAA